MEKAQSRLTIGAIYALATAALLATQSPLSFLAATRLSVPQFIAVTELVLLLCVPFIGSVVTVRLNRKPAISLHFATCPSKEKIIAHRAARAEQARPLAPRFFGHCRSRRRHRNFCVAKE